MKPQKQPQDQFSLFQANFKQLLNPKHPLVILSDQVHWDKLDAEFAGLWCEDNGAPAKATRLMIGLHYLKYMYEESDESVVDKWIENPYWQYFCGYSTMQHECPIHPTSMTKWRNRAGAEKLNILLTQTIEMAVEQKCVSKKELQQVNVDTTVQEKNITYPTDTKLLYKAIEKLVKAAKDRDIVLRQSYLRVGKRCKVRAARYAHVKQYKRMRKQLRKLKTYVGRLIRDIERKAGDNVDEQLSVLLSNCKKLREQKKDDSKKIYSLHEPEVCCITKGKERNRYEFGQKVSLVTTNRRNWFVGASLVHDNSHDGYTLAQALNQTEFNTGVSLTDAYVDKGYRYNDYQGEININVAGSGKKRLTKTQKDRRKRRSAIEPKIGHAKAENHLGRCYLKGLKGDHMNVILAAAGANMVKLLRLFACARLLRSMIVGFRLRQLCNLGSYSVLPQ